MAGVKHLSTGAPCPSPLPSGGSKLRLYSMRFCPYAQRVHLVLDAKAIPHETVYINLTHKPEWLQEKSPLGKVPALELPNGDVLYESLIIADYLDEKYPQRSLHDKDPLRKAQDRLLIERFNVVTGAMYRVFLKDDTSAVSAITSGLDVFEAELARRGSAFFGGPAPGMLDYMIWPWCERADLMRIIAGEKFQLDNVRFKKLLEWRSVMTNDSAVRQTMLDPAIHAKYFESKRDGHIDYEMPLTHSAKKQRLA